MSARAPCSICRANNEDAANERFSGCREVRCHRVASSVKPSVSELAAKTVSVLPWRAAPAALPDDAMDLAAGRSVSAMGRLSNSARRLIIRAGPLRSASLARPTSSLLRQAAPSSHASGDRLPDSLRRTAWRGSVHRRIDGEVHSGFPLLFFFLFFLWTLEPWVGRGGAIPPSNVSSIRIALRQPALLARSSPFQSGAKRARSAR